MRAISWEDRKFKFKRLHCWPLNLIGPLPKHLGILCFQKSLWLDNLLPSAPVQVVALQLLWNLFGCFYFFNLLNLTDITCFCFYLPDIIGNILDKSFGKGGKSPSISEVNPFTLWIGSIPVTHSWLMAIYLHNTMTTKKSEVKSSDI